MIFSVQYVSKLRWISTCPFGNGNRHERENGKGKYKYLIIKQWFWFDWLS